MAHAEVRLKPLAQLAIGQVLEGEPLLKYDAANERLRNSKVQRFGGLTHTALQRTAGAKNP